MLECKGVFLMYLLLRFSVFEPVMGRTFWSMKKPAGVNAMRKGGADHVHSGNLSDKGLLYGKKPGL